MRVKEADLRRMRSGIFLQRNLDDPNHIEMAGEIRSLAQRLCGEFERAPQGGQSEAYPSLSTANNGGHGALHRVRDTEGFRFYPDLPPRRTGE
jgi:hypothetical protein